MPVRADTVPAPPQHDRERFSQRASRVLQDLTNGIEAVTAGLDSAMDDITSLTSPQKAQSGSITKVPSRNLTRLPSDVAAEQFLSSQDGGVISDHELEQRVQAMQHIVQSTSLASAAARNLEQTHDQPARQGLV